MTVKNTNDQYFFCFQGPPVQTAIAWYLGPESNHIKYFHVRYNYSAMSNLNNGWTTSENGHGLVIAFQQYTWKQLIIYISI